MAYLRIHCDVCGGTWDVYHRDNWSDENARTCPHCFSKISRAVWEKNVIPAFCEAEDANAELFKEHTGYHRPLFTFDVIADHIYQNRQPGGSRTVCPVFEELQDMVNVLSENYFTDDNDPYGDELAADDFYKPDTENHFRNCPNLD